MSYEPQWNITICTITWRRICVWYMIHMQYILRILNTVYALSCFAVIIYAVPIIGKIFTGPTYKLLLSFTVNSNVYRSFIPTKSTFIKCCRNQWISKLPGSFDIHWVRQYLVYFTGLVGHCKRYGLQYRANFHKSRTWQMFQIFNTAYTMI